jgi:hypothetical protein
LNEHAHLLVVIRRAGHEWAARRRYSQGAICSQVWSITRRHRRNPACWSIGQGSFCVPWTAFGGAFSMAPERGRSVSLDAAAELPFCIPPIGPPDRRGGPRRQSTGPWRRPPRTATEIEPARAEVLRHKALVPKFVVPGAMARSIPGKRRGARSGCTISRARSLMEHEVGSGLACHNRCSTSGRLELL